jgi:hypothetical protein
MLRKVFLVIKVLLFLVAFFFFANHNPNSGLFLILFWLVFGIECAIRDYRDGSKISLGLNIVCILAAVTLLIVGIYKFY